MLCQIFELICCAARSEFLIRAEPEREQGRIERGGEKSRGRGLGQRNIKNINQTTDLKYTFQQNQER